MNIAFDIDGTPKSGDDARWRAVLDHDVGKDGAFVYAVRTTGIYCRPSCPSRRPGRANVTFYPLPEAAERAGYRACRRCRPRTATAQDPAIAAMRRACRFIEAQEDGPPALAELAAEVGLSPHHFQRQFKRLVGVSPREYADAVRLGRLRSALRSGDDVTGALYDAGYGAPSRLYEKSGAQLGMTPATYGKGGKGACIRYAFTDSPIGRLLVAATETGVCFLAFGDDKGLVRALAAEFPAAEAIDHDDRALGRWLAMAVAHLSGALPHPALPLDVRATAFQRRVWQALSEIPYGETRTYSDIAEALGVPRAQRAVGHACATNPVSLVIPCHRAIRADGGLGGYRWGLERKEALLAAERLAERNADGE